MAASQAPSLVMAKLTSLFLLLLLHLGCFFLTPPAKRRRQTQNDINDNKNDTATTKKRKLWSYLRGIVSTAYNYSCKSSGGAQTHPSASTPPPPRSSQNPSPEKSERKRPSLTESELIVNDSTDTNNNHNHNHDQDLIFPPLRNDIFPCTLCGEIFHKAQSLESHQSTKHAVSELLDGADSGKNIVRIIFKTGWSKTGEGRSATPTIHRILKIHNGSKILSRFEEHREAVKARAAARSRASAAEERCVADGNEHLRFHCSTFVCDLGRGGSSGVCGQQYCGVCGIIKSGFSPKLDGIPTMSTSWRAHLSVPEDVEEEFRFMNVKRAMLVCRVVAGRVGTDGDDDEKETHGFDSVFARTHATVDEEELLVFNPRAVLPCFVIVYTV